MFLNSEDFKQLGTLAIENRASNYYPLEAPQPLKKEPSPLSKVGMNTTTNQFFSIGNRISNVEPVFDPKEQDPDKKRSSHIKNLVADRKKEE